jgi:uncharacterized membrane protein YkoI
MRRRLVIASLLLLVQVAAHARILPLPEQAQLGLGAYATLQEGQTEEREPGPADLDEAVEIALKRYGGEVTNRDTVVREGKRVHEIRILGDDGVVHNVRIDPETGRFIPQEGRDD